MQHPLSHYHADIHDRWLGQVFLCSLMHAFCQPKGYPRSELQGQPPQQDAMWWWWTVCSASNGDWAEGSDLISLREVLIPSFHYSALAQLCRGAKSSKTQFLDPNIRYTDSHLLLFLSVAAHIYECYPLWLFGWGADLWGSTCLLGVQTLLKFGNFTDLISIHNKCLLCWLYYSTVTVFTLCA